MPWESVKEDVARALKEDLGPGDLSSLFLEDKKASALILCREEAVLCGIPWVEEVFSFLEGRAKIEWFKKEGEDIHPQEVICRIEAGAHALLAGERTALNFLQLLSATATATRLAVAQVAGTGAEIYDTRKTIPGLRAAQKYAVRVGGGKNHRMGLFDAVLLKENHIAEAGGVAKAFLLAKKNLPSGFAIEVEVEDLQELEEALTSGANLILLDNFSLDDMRRAADLARGGAILEASGNITLENLPEVAKTGVQRISMGSLTKNIQAVDFSLRMLSC